MNKVHHIAIIGSDYEVSKQFYIDVLSLEVIREVYREERKSYKLDLALNGEHIIELFSFPNPPKRPSRPVDEFTQKRFTFIADPDDLPIEFYEK